MQKSRSIVSQFFLSLYVQLRIPVPETVNNDADPVETVAALRTLVISDVHSNLAALEAVLKDAGQFDTAICAGDTVGYGPDPVECIEALTRRHVRCVAGNHDVAVITRNVARLNAYAAKAIIINRRLLNIKTRTWLELLPHTLSLKVGETKAAVFHGSPLDPISEYVLPREAVRRAERYFELTGTDLIILGHTHIPFIHRSDQRVLLNPGSVGQPRDGDPRASYMLVDLDDEGIGVSHRRVEYDIMEVASRIRRRGLPEMLANRLFSGW